jgi:hypothetical protein
MPDDAPVTSATCCLGDVDDVDAMNIPFVNGLRMASWSQPMPMASPSDRANEHAKDANP